MVVATVSVQDLHDQTEPILRRVSEGGETIEVFDGDKPLARLVPAPAPRRPMTPEELDTFWAEWDQLAAEIGAHWPEGVSVEDAIRDIRREL